MLLCDTEALKCPCWHVWHTGWAVLEPIPLVLRTFLVNLPAGHFVCSVQESVLALVLDATALNHPSRQYVHLGWAVTEPTTSVYEPAAHSVCAKQESVLVLILDSAPVKNPAVHASHWG